MDLLFFNVPKHYTLLERGWLLVGVDDSISKVGPLSIGEREREKHTLINTLYHRYTHTHTHTLACVLRVTSLCTVDIIIDTIHKGNWNLLQFT